MLKIFLFSQLYHKRFEEPEHTGILDIALFLTEAFTPNFLSNDFR